MFDADKPILSSEQDRLGRTTFAKSLARCILDHNIPDSLVISLTGGLGSGKTSIINLMLEEIKFAAGNMFDEEKPIILNFSPWSYSGQQQIIYSFFRRLSSEIQQFPYLENKFQIITLLELYVSFFTHNLPSKIATNPKKFRINFLKKNTEGAVFGWDAGKDLTLIKAELNHVLSEQKHKLIIIIDNIGRLDDSEIKQMFQAIKSIGNFSNTIYLLAYDENIIKKAITTFHHGDSQEFLEKIVQLSFQVPIISPQSLESILFDRLKKIIEITPEGRWNNDYWADVYYAYIRHFFNNCRDITRYINTLGFSYIHVKDVVNPVDFFVLTVLEVFEPNVYIAIRDNKDLFTDLIDNVYDLSEDPLHDDKARCDNIIQLSQKLDKNALLGLLIYLFPRLRYIYYPKEKFYHSETIARKNFRVCSPDLFDTYFRMSLSLGIISESELNTLLSLTSDLDIFTESLLRLNQDERGIQFLNLLDGMDLSRLVSSRIKNIIYALLEITDLLPPGKHGILEFDPHKRMHRVIHQLLRRFKPDERYHILRDAITKANKSLYSIVYELIEQSKEHSEIEDVYLPLEHRDLKPEHLEDLKKLAVDKIKFWADIERLIEHPKLLPILYAWKDWGHEDECRNFIANVTQTDRGIIAFLIAALAVPIEEAISKLEKRAEWADALKNVEDFIAPEKLEPHAKELFEDLYFEKLREREQLALMIFLDLIKAETRKIIPKTTV